MLIINPFHLETLRFTQVVMMNTFEAMVGLSLVLSFGSIIVVFTEKTKLVEKIFLVSMWWKGCTIRQEELSIHDYIKRFFCIGSLGCTSALTDWLNRWKSTLCRNCTDQYGQCCTTGQKCTQRWNYRRCHKWYFRNSQRDIYCITGK